MVLIVEDDDVQRLVLVTELGKGGFRLAEAIHGEHALEVIARERPDIIVTDLMMPVLDGFGLIEKVKGMPGLDGLPIIAISASNSPDIRKKALSLGIADFMLKPFETAALVERIHRYI